MSNKPHGPVSERVMRHFYGPSGYTAVQAEGARVAIATCRVCGAAVLLDPRDAQSPAELHAKWHQDQHEEPR